MLIECDYIDNNFDMESFMKTLNLIALGTVLALLIAGCSFSIPPKGGYTDTNLPIVSISGHIEDMKSVAFEWKDVDDSKVKGIYVYRSSENGNDSKLKIYDKITNRFATHYEDTDVKPNTRYMYAFTTYSKKYQSEKSMIISVTTLPILTSVSWIAAVQNMPRSVKILWKPQTNPRVSGYILERKSLRDSDFKKLASIDGRFSVEYVDTDLDNGELYQYRLRAVTYDDLISTPSMVVQAVTKSIPSDIQGLTITTNLPQKIKLIWQPSTIKNLNYYKIYRGKRAWSSFFSHFKYYANVTDTTFVDDIPENGKKYFYKITAVNKDGLEGNTEILAQEGSTLAAPDTPTSFEVKIVGKKAELKWKESDPKAKTFTVTKTSKVGWFGSSKTKEITGLTGTSYTDSEVYSKVRYKYNVVAVDENNISSEPTNDINLFTKKDLPPFSYNAIQENNETKSDSVKPQEKKPNPTPETNSSVKAAPNLDTSTL